MTLPLASSAACSSTLPWASSTRTVMPSAEPPSEKPPSQVMLPSRLSKQSKRGVWARTGAKGRVSSRAVMKRNMGLSGRKIADDGIAQAPFSNFRGWASFAQRHGWAEQIVDQRGDARRAALERQNGNVIRQIALLEAVDLLDGGLA